MPLYDSTDTYDGVPGTAASYSLGELTDDCLRQLRGTTRDLYNILAQTISAPPPLTVQTVFLTNNINGVTVGSLLAVGAETMYVLNTYPATVSVQVIRGFDDTTPVVVAAGSMVVVDPSWPRSLVQARIKDEIRSWGPQVFRVANVEIPIATWQRGYDLSAIITPIIRILRVTAQQPPYIGSPGEWTTEANGAIDTVQANPDFSFDYQPNANPAEFPSGKAIILTSPVLPIVQGNLHVVYATPFDVDDSWLESTDMISQVGIDSRDLDIPALGTAARLLRMVSVRRAMLNVEGQSRDDQDVTMPAILQAAQQFQQATESRLGDVQQRLFSDWPIRSSNF